MRFKVFEVHIDKVLFVGAVISLGFFESPGLFSSEQCSPFVAEFKTCEIAFFLILANYFVASDPINTSVGHYQMFIHPTLKQPRCFSYSKGMIGFESCQFTLLANSSNRCRQCILPHWNFGILSGFLVVLDKRPLNL